MKTKLGAIAALGLALGLTLGLTACVEPVPPGDGGEMENACGAAELQGLVGQSRDVLAAMTLPEPVRVIEPGSAVTMDYNPARLNISIAEDGRIDRVYCS